MTLPACSYADLIEDAMTRYLPQWDWHWGAAQLYAESAWNPAAKSPVGALGIAQFMPDTWADVADDLGYPTTATPLQPEYAIPAYAYYMHNLRMAWTAPRPEVDRMRLTQASYNAGMGNILRAQRAAAGANDYATIIAALPQVTGVKAKQTTDYVTRIQQFYAELATV